MSRRLVKDLAASTTDAQLKLPVAPTIHTTNAVKDQVALRTKTLRFTITTVGGIPAKNMVTILAVISWVSVVQKTTAGLIGRGTTYKKAADHKQEYRKPLGAIEPTKRP